MAYTVAQRTNIVYVNKNTAVLWRHFIFALTIFIILNLPYNETIFLIITGVLCFIFYLYLAYKDVKVSSLWVTPISVFMLWNAINLGLASAYLGYLDLTGKKILFAFHHMNIEALINSLKISVVGTFFFHFGIEKIKPVSWSIVENLTNTRSIKLLFVLSIGYYFFSQYFLFTGSLLYPLKFGAIAALSFYALTSSKTFNQSFRKKFVILLAGSFILFAINISTMSKEEMMFSFLPILWFSIKNTKARGYTVLLLSILIPFYFLFVAPLSSDLRYQYWKGMEISTTESVGNVLEGKEKDWNPTTISKLDVFFMRSAQITPLAYLLDEIEYRGYMNGETLKYLAFSFIPRIFWADKPFVTQSSWFTYYIGMARSPEEATSATGITAIGELYWNFGYAGVILGMLILGLGFGGLWRLASNPLNSLIAMTIYIILIFNMRGFSEFGSTIVAFVILFLITKVLYKIKDSYLSESRNSKKLFQPIKI